MKQSIYVARRPAQRGQTLMELMVSLGVISIILSMTTALYIQMFNHFGKVSADVNAQSEARFAMGRAADELRQAMSDPNQAVPAPPVSFPLPPVGATPTPASDVQFTMAHTIPGTADYNNLTYDTVDIQTAATPAPGHVFPNLILTRTPPNGIATTTVIGRDVESFFVVPVTNSIYDIQVVCAPPEGITNIGQANQTIRSSFTVNTRVFISYYQ
jgi:prepilin-type N-terminal cleavage/methylation domain-containing protein